MASDPAPSRTADRPLASRPLSPHLQIWRWTPTMAASIFHRATGIALYVGTILVALWLFAVAAGSEIYAATNAFLASPIGLIIVFGYAVALFFHTLNGLRHLYWDAGRGFAMETVKKTSIAVFAGAAFLAILLFAAIFAGIGG